MGTRQPTPNRATQRLAACLLLQLLLLMPVAGSQGSAGGLGIRDSGTAVCEGGTVIFL
jgi:hypothetical protein